MKSKKYKTKPFSSEHQIINKLSKDRQKEWPEKYQSAKEHAEHILALFYEAKITGWKAKPVANLLADLFSMAQQRQWFPGTTATTSKDVLRDMRPFWNKERVGICILLYVASLSEDTWSKAGGWNLNLFQRLHLGDWTKPQQWDQEGKLASGKIEDEKLKTRKKPFSFSEKLEQIQPEQQKNNRELWDQLAKDIDYLQRESSLIAFEHEPYSTAIFRFNKILFRNQLSDSFLQIDHSKLCEIILAPLYFSAIYDLKSLAQVRIKRQKKSINQLDGSKIRDIRDTETYAPLDRCLSCGKPLLSIRKRTDSKFCDSGCRGDYHNKKKRDKSS